MIKNILIAYALSATMTCQAIQYRVQDIGLSTAKISHASAINDQGDVAGTFMMDDDVIKAFLWKQGEGLRLLSNMPEDFAITSINNQGQIVGFFTASEGTFFPKKVIHPFIWSQEGQFKDLGSINSTNTLGLHINDEGAVFLATPSTGEGFLWKNGKLEKILSNLPLMPFMKGHHIAYVNKDVLDQQTPFKSVFLNLKTQEATPFLDHFQGTPLVNGLNEEGYVVGIFKHNANMIGFISNTKGDLTTFKEFTPFDINDNGIAVGRNASKLKGIQGAIFLIGESQPHDIHELIIASDVQTMPYEGILGLFRINRNNWIIGTALRDDLDQAILLIPN